MRLEATSPNLAAAERPRANSNLQTLKRTTMIFLTFFKTLHEVWTEAMELRRESQKRYRYMDY